MTGCLDENVTLLMEDSHGSNAVGHSGALPTFALRASSLRFEMTALALNLSWLIGGRRMADRMEM